VENPHANARLLIGDDPISGNPKLNNVAKGWSAAKHDRIVMADSNLSLPVDYVSRLNAAWSPGTGLVSSPAFGADAGNLAARVECAVLNGNQARVQLAAAALDRGFAQGKTLYFDRPTLNRAGGLQALGRDLAEDVGATKATRSLGLKVRLTARPFAQPIGRRNWRAVWDRQLRWSRVRRAGFPTLFLFEPLNGPALPVLALAQTGLLAPIALLAAWYGAEALLARRGGWQFGVADVLACLIRDLMMPAIWIATFVRPGFTWRGTEMVPAPSADTATVP
jgi:ceramide glucosyltransferase